MTKARDIATSTVTTADLTAEVGSTIQAHDADLDTISGLAKTDGNVIVGDGANWVAEDPATVRTSLGLGTAATTAATDYATAAQASVGTKNLIINGDMRIAQRGTSFTGVGGSSLQYTLDRWSVREATDAVVDVSQAVDSPSTDLFKYCLKLDVTTADTSIAAGQVCTVQHRMEAQDLVLARFGTANAKQLTISFWHKHTKTGTYSVGFTNHNGTRGYPAEYTQSVSDTWEKSTVTFTADTTGTWATDNTLGMIVYFSVAAGTDFHAAVDTWTGANDFASANQVNALDSTSNSFRLTGVQLEVGTEATPFENRMYSTELAMCERYFQKNYLMEDAPGVATSGENTRYMHGSSDGSSNGAAGVFWRGRMRATPTVTWYTDGGTQGQWNYARSGASGTGSFIAYRVGDTGANGYMGVGAAWATCSVWGNWTANAEL